MRGILVLCCVCMLSAAAAAQPVCGPYGKFAPMREVTGQVVSEKTEWFSGRHVIIRDARSGCLVFLRTEDKSCLAGKTFDGFGRLKSLSGDDYQATFRFFREPRTACS